MKNKNIETTLRLMADLKDQLKSEIEKEIFWASGELKNFLESQYGKPILSSVAYLLINHSMNYCGVDHEGGYCKRTYNTDGATYGGLIHTKTFDDRKKVLDLKNDLSAFLKTFNISLGNFEYGNGSSTYFTIFIKVPETTS